MKGYRFASRETVVGRVCMQILSIDGWTSCADGSRCGAQGKKPPPKSLAGQALEGQRNGVHENGTAAEEVASGTDVYSGKKTE